MPGAHAAFFPTVCTGNAGSLLGSLSFRSWTLPQNIPTEYSELCIPGGFQDET